MANVEDRSIPFLMHLIVGRVEALVNHWARPLGLKIEGVRVLFRLLAGDRTVNELARLTGVELSTLSRLLTRMEARGFIARRRDAADGRSVIISLTSKGRALALQHQPVYFKDYETILMNGFSPEDARRFRELLVRMLDNLETSGGDPITALRGETEERRVTA
ncbi:MAG: MarR family winged helix-turn-helix transcriptional regulator [Alphaproteobacteria bacterium]